MTTSKKARGGDSLSHQVKSPRYRLKKTNYSKWAKTKLIKEIKKLQKGKKYGLVWDEEKTKEIFEKNTQNKLPILKEITKNKITNDPKKPVNILIKGDNYHALSVLNYTHKGKIDMIYIDPPYNTGNKFRYNDSLVKNNDSYKHSKWLSFMNKRLHLAKKLLTKKGIIFISIDDNEHAQLKLLCDEIFGKNNFIGSLPRITKKSGKSSTKISKNHDYILIFQKSDSSKLQDIEHFDKDFKRKDKYFEERGFYKLNQTLDYSSLRYSSSLDYEIKNGKSYLRPGGVTRKKMLERKKTNPERDFCWRWCKELYNFGLKNDLIVIKNYKNSASRIYTKTYQNVIIGKKNKKYILKENPRTKNLTTLDFVDNKFSNDNAKKVLKQIFQNVVFDYPKPVSLIKALIDLMPSNDSIILDFFAGSGTTGHAVLESNKNDFGNRQFILCTNNENMICEKVCYPRIKKVINGYTFKNDNSSRKNKKQTEPRKKIDGLGGNLRYFQTDFVDQEPTDKNKKQLVAQSTQMLCLKENYFFQTKKTKNYVIFKNNKKYLAIIYDDLGIKPIKKQIKLSKQKFIIYVFSLDESAREEEFEDVARYVELKPIPQEILNVYRRLFG